MGHSNGGVRRIACVWLVTLASLSGAGADDESLHRSAQFQPVYDILRHLETGVDVNAYDDRGWTALHAAAGRDVAVQQLLIDHGADVHARTRDGTDHTALHLAVQFGTDSETDLHRIEALMDAGADPNALSASGETAIHFAARRGDLHIALVLLEHGADPNVRESQFGRAPLHEAHIRDHSKWAKVFGEQPGVDLNIKDDAGHTPDDCKQIRRKHSRGTPNKRAQVERGLHSRRRMTEPPAGPSRSKLMSMGLIEWLSHLRLPQLSGVLERLGVQVPQDVKFLEVTDLTGVGVPLAQARRLIHSVRTEL